MDDVVEMKPKPARTAALVGAGLVAGLVLAGLTTADAQTPTPTPNASASEEPRKAGHLKHDKHDKEGRHGARGHGRIGKLGVGVQHGEFVLRERDGTFRTMAVQRGVATAISATSVTVKSEDGFSRTYARDEETKVAEDLKAGDVVRVLAVVENGRALALHVRPGKMRDRAGGA